MQKDALLKSLDLCSRCGGCKALCPTYEESPQEGMSARGRLMIVRALLNGSLAPTEGAREHISSCLLCRACEGLCPLGIDIPEAIYAGRARLSHGDRKLRTLRRIARFATKRPDLSFRIMRLSRPFLMPLLARRGILPVAPDIPEIPFRAMEQVHTVPQKRGRVAIFAGCSVNFLYPYLGVSLLNVLQDLGYEVVLPKDEVCCGAPLRALGLEAQAVDAAQKNLQIFSRLKVDAVLSLCPTCTVSLRDEYRKIIGTGVESAMDISTFLAGKLPASLDTGRTAVFHDPCHLLYGLGIAREPRALIEEAGLALRSTEGPLCCGFGGTFSFSQRNLSRNFQIRQAERLRSTGADMVITSCPGCLLYLGQQITDRPVLHLIEVIEDALCHRDRKETRQAATGQTNS